MNLSEHFTVEELTVSETAARLGLDNVPQGEALANLTRLAGFLEEVRALVDAPILINSAYRAPDVNRSVGGAKTSQHCLGLAADIRVPGMTPDQVVRLIKGSGLVYDQLIREFESWTHVSIPPLEKEARLQALIIDRTGTRAFA
jgi:zinc D-Ala-D-Ala carboxypeptidase